MSTFVEHLQAALAPAYALGPELTGAGMSRVFTATEVALGRRVVVKVLPPELAAGVNRDRFRREIQLAAQLQHPHIVPLLSAGEHDELLWYTMPFIEGESLRARLERGALPVRDVVRILHDVLDALAYAHARGVIHRDIKPANILTQGQHALVTDFGVAKAISAALPAAGMTTSGMAIGTPAYMAPEQLAADPAADHRVDLYAVGLLAYELLSGESPFASLSPTATLAAQLTRDPPPLAQVRGDVPPALSALVMRCLAKDPARRPADAAALLAELDELPSGSGAHAPPSRAQPRAALRALAVLGAFAALGTVWAVTRKPGHAARVAVTPPAKAAPAAPAPPVRRDTAPSTTFEIAGGAARAPLTQADSFAIARALRERLQPAPAPASASAAKPKAGGTSPLTTDMVDSIVRASLSEWSRYPRGTEHLAELSALARRTAEAARAGRAAETRRIAIVPPATDDDPPALARLGRDLVRDLRDRLRERGRRFQVLDADSVRAAAQRNDEVGAVAAALHADLVGSVSLIRIPGDSVVVLVKLRDLTAATPWSYRVAASRTVPLAEAAGALEPILRQAIGYIEEMSAAPRRGTPPSQWPAPGVPAPPKPSGPE